MDTKGLANHCTTCGKDTNLRCPICKRFYCCPECRRNDPTHTRCRPPQDWKQILKDEDLDKKIRVPVYRDEMYIFLPGLEGPVPNGIYDIFSEEMKDFREKVFGGKIPTDFKYVIKSAEAPKILPYLSPKQFLQVMHACSEYKKKNSNEKVV